MGIFDKKEHITIKIDINWHHGFCYLGYFCDKNIMESYGSDTIRVCCNIALDY